MACWEDALGGWSIATATVIQDGQQSSILYNNIYNAYGITLRPGELRAGLQRDQCIDFGIDQSTE